MSAYKTIGQQLGANLITGLGEFKAGRGAIITDWHPTADAALRQFCKLSGQAALDRALGNWFEWRNPLTAAQLADIYALCGPAARESVDNALREMTSNAVTTPVNLGTAYDNIYLKMTVYDDGCGPGMAPNPNYPQTGYQKNFQCVTSGTKVNGSKVTKSSTPAVYSTNDATTAHNLFIGTPSVQLPNNKVPNIFALIPCNGSIQHAWEDTPYYNSSSWSHQDIFFLVSASSCGRNANYPASGSTARLVQ